MEYYTINDIKILTGYNEKQIRLIIKKLNDEVLEKYASFKTKADALLERRGKKAFPNNEKNNIINLFIVVLISFLFIALAIYTMESFLAGDYIDCIWLIIFLFSWLIPSIRERFVQASYYIKRKIKNSNHE